MLQAAEAFKLSSRSFKYYRKLHASVPFPIWNNFHNLPLIHRRVNTDLGCENKKFDFVFNKRMAWKTKVVCRTWFYLYNFDPGTFYLKGTSISVGHFNFHMATNLIQILIELESGQLQKPCLVIHNLDPFSPRGQSSLHRFLSVYTALDIQWKTPLKILSSRESRAELKCQKILYFMNIFNLT